MRGEAKVGPQTRGHRGLLPTARALPRIAGLRHLALAALGILSSPCLQNTTFASRKTGRAGDPVTGLEENQKWSKYFRDIVTHSAR